MIKIAFITTIEFDKVITRKKLWRLAESQNLWPFITNFSHPLYDFQKNINKKDDGEYLSFFQELIPIVEKYYGPQTFNSLFQTRVENLERDFPEKRMVLLCEDVKTHSNFDMVKECGFTTIGIPRLKSAVSLPATIYRLVNKSDIVIDKNMPVDEFEIQLERLWHNYFRSIGD